jgi:hypothetical protein
VIHHLSIPARDTRHVADVLAELLGGVVTAFGPYPDSWIAWAGDEHGTAIEVYPVGTEMYPPDGHGQAAFRRVADASGATATHATVSLDRSEDEIFAVAEREGWRALRLPRGPFDVIEFWIEDAVMLELMTPEMSAAYLASTPRMPDLSLGRRDR